MNADDISVLFKYLGHMFQILKKNKSSHPKSATFLNKIFGILSLNHFDPWSVSVSKAIQISSVH